MKRHIVSLSLATGLAGTVIPLTAIAAESGRGCSNATLHGQYSLRATGDVLGVGPFAAVGVFNYDGNGHVIATIVTRINGVNGQSDNVGTYSVNADCFVNDSLTATTGAVSTHESVIFDHGNGFFILNTTAGAPNVIIGEARRQAARRGNAREE
jgi:hypothetical protein